MYSENDRQLEIKSKISGQVDGFQKICRNTKDPPEKIIHELRKNIKRTRALFRFLKPLISEHSFHHIDGKLAKIAHSFTLERESSVNLALYSSLLESNDIKLSETSRKIILRRLVHERDQAYSNWVSGLNGTLLRHQITMSRILDEIEDLAVTSGAGELEIRAIQSTHIRAIRYYNNSVLSLQTETLHKWRKQLKRLLFQLKFGIEEKSQEILGKVVFLDKLTGILGKDHDMAILEQKITEVFKKDISRDELQHLLNLIDKQRNALQKEAFQMGKELAGFSFSKSTLIHETS